MLKKIKKYFENVHKRAELLNDKRIFSEALYLLDCYYRKDEIDTIKDKDGVSLPDIIKEIKEKISVDIVNLMLPDDED
jgi:hypothetical protein